MQWIQFSKCYPVLELPIESKLVLRFPVWDFISLEPIERSFQISRLKSSHIFNICNQSTANEYEYRINLNSSWWFNTLRCCELFLLLKSPASGSSVLITMTFQSVSPSSIRARVPKTFTLIISPREQTWELKSCFENACKHFINLYVLITHTWSYFSTLLPMSHMSIGSLSPQQPVSPSLWLGSSHVCGKGERAERCLMVHRSGLVSWCEQDLPVE